MFRQRVISVLQMQEQVLVQVLPPKLQTLFGKAAAAAKIGAAQRHGTVMEPTVRHLQDGNGGGAEA